MTKATTRGFFFAGTVFFVILFILLTIHTHTTIAARTHADELSPAVVRGLHVWGHYNCENCHTLLGEGAYYAPDLTQIVKQKGTAYLSQFLLDPSRFYSEERDGRLMPTLGLSASEIEDVLAFLAWVGQIDTNGWPPRPIIVSGVAQRGAPEAPAGDAVGRGREIFQGIGGCVACHSLEPGRKLVGPSLAGVGSRAQQRIAAPDYGGGAHDAAGYLRESILSPNAYLVGREFVTPDGSSFMPSTYAASFTPAQLDDLVAFLLSLREESR